MIIILIIIKIIKIIIVTHRLQKFKLILIPTHSRLFLTHVMLAIQIMVYYKQNKQNILTIFLLKGNEWQSNSLSMLSNDT